MSGCWASGGRSAAAAAARLLVLLIVVVMVVVAVMMPAASAPGGAVLVVGVFDLEKRRRSSEEGEEEREEMRTTWLGTVVPFSLSLLLLSREAPATGAARAVRASSISGSRALRRRRGHLFRRDGRARAAVRPRSRRKR